MIVVTNSTAGRTATVPIEEENRTPIRELLPKHVKIFGLDYSYLGRVKVGGSSFYTGGGLRGFKR